MKIQGDHTFEAPRDLVWEALMDPAVIGKIIPGCDDLQQVGDNTFEGAMNIKVGPVQGKFQGKVELSELVPPESYRLQLDGKGPSGFVNGGGQLILSDDGDDKTKLSYDIDAKVGGRIASVGQRLLDSSARVVTRQAFEGLDQVIAHRLATSRAAASGSEGEAAADVPPEPQAPSQAEFAANFTRGLLAELIPPERRPLVFTIVGVVLLVVVLLLFRAC